KAKKALDRGRRTAESPKKRGRPGMSVTMVIGRAHNNELLLSSYWGVLKESLLKAETKENVEAALQVIYETQRAQFTPYAELIYEVLKDKKFPKTDKAQI